MYNWEAAFAMLKDHPDLINVQPSGKDDNKRRWPILHQARHAGETKIVMQLLERGANAAAQNSDQMKAIDITDDDLMRDILNDADRSLGDCTERCSHVVAMPCASAIELFIHFGNACCPFFPKHA